MQEANKRTDSENVTGVHERLVLGQALALTEEEHLARYRFAAGLVTGRRVADIACGTGYGTRMLSQAGANSVLGMDLSEDAVNASKTLNHDPKVSYEVADAQMLTAISDNEFDVVVSFETIEHLPDVEAYLAEMARIVQPGGIFVVSTPDRRLSSVMHCFRGRPSNPHHIREYTEPELLERISTRFDIKTIYGQSFVPRWLVLWPVQVIIRSVCRILGFAKAITFKDALYSDWGNVEVVPKRSTHGIAKFWVIVCTPRSNA
jgi:O-antigen biosynthesis protein